MGEISIYPVGGETPMVIAELEEFQGGIVWKMCNLLSIPPEHIKVVWLQDGKSTEFYYNHQNGFVCTWEEFSSPTL